jgi:class 3 adenylate cyclase
MRTGTENANGVAASRQHSREPDLRLGAAARLPDDKEEPARLTLHSVHPHVIPSMGMATEAATRYARSGDVHIAYQVAGEGADLLFVPDGVIPIESMAEWPSFDRFIRRLTRLFRVIRFDRRGMGLSDPVTPSNRPTLEQWMTDAEAVLGTVDSERAALLGMAEGGFVLTLLAAAKPERVSGLILVNATAAFTTEPFRAWGLAAGALDRLAGTVESDWGDVGWAIPMFAPSAAGDKRYRAWLERAQRRSLSPAMARALFDVMYRSDIRDILPSLRVPTLVIHRQGNRYLEPEHGRYLAAHIPGATYLEVEGEDHVPYLGDSEPILEAIEEFLTGRRHPPEVDRVLATVLFTDIVGSTERAAQLGDARWRELLLAHHDIVRAELERFAGREIDTAGDGVFAAFDGPARAVRCACEIVEAVRRLGLQVRAGVHTGECELVGHKLGGLAVHIGARIAGLSGPGEVLASSTVKDLVAGSGLRFEDRGLHELQGVPGEWHIHAVQQEP